MLAGLRVVANNSYCVTAERRARPAFTGTEPHRPAPFPQPGQVHCTLLCLPSQSHCTAQKCGAVRIRTAVLFYSNQHSIL